MNVLNCHVMIALLSHYKCTIILLQLWCNMHVVWLPATVDHGSTMASLHFSQMAVHFGITIIALWLHYDITALIFKCGHLDSYMIALRFPLHLYKNGAHYGVITIALRFHYPCLKLHGTMALLWWNYDSTRFDINPVSPRSCNDFTMIVLWFQVSFILL